jgi:hypothetical protein
MKIELFLMTRPYILCCEVPFTEPLKNEIGLHVLMGTTFKTSYMENIHHV